MSPDEEYLTAVGWAPGPVAAKDEPHVIRICCREWRIVPGAEVSTCGECGRVPKRPRIGRVPMPVPED